MDILRRIAKDKRVEIKQLKSKLPLDSLVKSEKPKSVSFKDAITLTGKVNIIAEIKKGSPSKGIIAHLFEPAAIAKQYTDGGAAALSVLTESKYFFGDYTYIKQAKSASDLPVLCKDFVVDPYQIHHAQYIGADAVLLIVALHDPLQLSDHLKLASELGIDALTEVHNEDELDIALDCGATIIGVNNRDLTSFEVSLDTSIRLADKIPEDVVKLAESGIFDYGDICRLQESGYNAFLIGEALMRAANSTELIKELRGE